MQQTYADKCWGIAMDRPHELQKLGIVGACHLHYFFSICGHYYVTAHIYITFAREQVRKFIKSSYWQFTIFLEILGIVRSKLLIDSRKVKEM